MHVIEPRDIKRRQEQREVRKKRVRHRFIIGLVCILFISYAFTSYRWKLPSVKAQPVILLPTLGTPVQMAWPGYGQAAVGTPQYGVLDTSGDSTPMPTASVAKVITAMAVMKEKPFAAGTQGPTITLDDTDVGYYDYYSSNDGSVVYVVNGEQISEYQALQAMLLPSANNMADSLARWAFGSQEAYKNYANNMVKTLGMTKTTVADASGFAPTTTSTARDLVALGLSAINDKVISNIVGQSSAVIPVAGTINNVNVLLGTNGIVGIKTGNTDAAGGVYLFASNHMFDNGLKTTVVGAIMGAPSLGAAMDSSIPLLNSVYAGFDDIQVARAGQKVAEYKYPWGKTVDAVLTNNLSVFGWTGATVRPQAVMSDISDIYPAGTPVGTVYVKTGMEQSGEAAVTKQATASPPWYWRIFRPFL